MADETSTDETEATEVEIFGAVYHVRGRDDRQYLQGLARRVDRTMREIAGQVSTVDTAKIAILAALNLADELSRCQQRGDREGTRGGVEEVEEEVKERITALATELSEALES
jgi:cell division protein ZapA